MKIVSSVEGNGVLLPFRSVCVHVYVYSASADTTPIGIGGRFKQTIVASSTVNSGSGFTTKSILYVAGHVVFNLFVSVTTTVCVFVLNGFLSSGADNKLPSSSVYKKDIS